MIRIKCKCGNLYGQRNIKDIDLESWDMISNSSLDNSFTSIDACPACSKRWTRTKISGINWSMYPALKQVIMRFKWK